MTLRYSILDVFANQALAGNPLAVVYDATHLSDQQMQAIAAEFNLSETTFTGAPKQDGHEAEVRIFTPGNELPFAGHPTVGTAIALAKRRFGENAVQDAVVVLEEKVGSVRCAVSLREDGSAYAEFDLPKLSEQVGEIGTAEQVATALGLGVEEVGCAPFEGGIYDAGVPFAIVPLASIEAVRNARPGTEGWDDAFGRHSHNNAFVFCRGGEGEGTSFHARMFWPATGIIEDPATGSAVASFSGAIARYEGLEDGTHKIRIEQGYEMGRPSVIHLEIDMQNGVMVRGRIGGNATKVAEGELLL